MTESQILKAAEDYARSVHGNRVASTSKPFIATVADFLAGARTVVDFKPSKT